MNAITKIRKYLPYRYSKEIQKRIIENGGKKYALNYISMCLADPPLRHNEMIINEAARWAEEIRARKLQTNAILETL